MNNSTLVAMLLSAVLLACAPLEEVRRHEFPSPDGGASLVLEERIGGGGGGWMYAKLYLSFAGTTKEFPLAEFRHLSDFSARWIDDSTLTVCAADRTSYWLRQIEVETGRGRRAVVVQAACPGLSIGESGDLP